MTQTKAIEVTTTTPDQECAESLAKRLVEERLAACVQITGPITSVYRWEGKVENSTEWRLTIKARQGDFSRLSEAIFALHPYDVPEILAVPIVAGHPAYLDWMGQA